jgi:hypothetical protein
MTRETAPVVGFDLGDEGREPDAEAAWVDEAERRFEELESGAAAAIPSDQVFEEARSRLK